MRKLDSKPLVSVVIPTHNRKQKLFRLIEGVRQSDYPNVEIVVVDDFSTDGTFDAVRLAFPDVKIIRNQSNLLLAGSRNVGIEGSSGSLLFLVDDDNVMAKDTISELAASFDDSRMGLAAPVMYYLSSPERIWCAGVVRNMSTSRTILVGKDTSLKFNGLIRSDDCPNAFMLRREVIEKVGLFDKATFPIHYDEADFGERVRKAGYRVFFVPSSKVWHDIPLPEEEKDKSRLFHVHNEYRAFYASRNRILFHKKYSSRLQFIVFMLFFNWLFTGYYLSVILFNSRKSILSRLSIAGSYCRGILSAAGGA